jgi:hypothetical protein
VTIFDYYLDIEFNFVDLACLNSIALTIVIIGLSIQPVCVNLELSRKRSLVKPYCHNR